MKSTHTQLILARINPLDAVDIASICSVEKTGEQLKVTYLDGDGKKQVKDTKATDFVMDQIREYAIEYSEV